MYNGEDVHGVSSVQAVFLIFCLISLCVMYNIHLLCHQYDEGKENSILYIYFNI